MKKINIYIVFLLMMIRFVNAQNCDPLTPVFNIDLTGQPNGTWISTPVIRDGHCCSASGSDACLQFNVTLDSLAEAISFDIISGAVPGGALFYQINCGPAQTLGTPICLNGPGPHIITFCKPGNNTNTYAITSIGQPEMQGTQWVSQACSGSMSVSSLVESSITWTSVPANALYDSFLSCTSGCDSVTVQATVGSSLPPYIDYMVCGNVSGNCGAPLFCDTLRINFVNDLAVSITPVNPVLCFGITDTLLTANVSGGLAPFSYSWNNGANTQSIRVGPGTFIVSITDSRNCSVANDTVVVTQMASAITANAGNDIDLCVQSAVAFLSGNITTANGGYWSGGTGSFNPDSTSLSPTYIPSTSEINAGFTNLTLTTSGNGGCPAATDQVQLRIFPNPIVEIGGLQSVCLNSTHVYTSPYNSSYTYSWTVTGGLITQNTINSISVLWNSSGTRNIQLLVNSNNGCDSTININVNVNPLPNTSISGSLQNCTPGNFIYQVASSIGSQYLWTATNGNFVTSTNLNPVTINYLSAGNSVITVTETDTNGCSSFAIQNVQLIQRPIPVITGPTSVCLNETQTYSYNAVSGIISTWTVNGGAVTSSSQNMITVTWNTAGSGSLSLYQSSTAGCDSSVTLNVDVHPNPVGAITGITNVCQSHSATYSVLPIDTSITYSWSIIGTSVISSTSTNLCIVDFNSTGTNTLNALLTSSDGCTLFDTFPIEVYQQPTPVLLGDTQVCAGAVCTYICQAGNINTWTISGGIILSQSSDSIVVKWNAPGQGTVTLNSSNQAICDTTISLAITVAPVSVPVIVGNSTICSNQAVQFIVGGNLNTDQILWNITSGIILSSNSDDTLTILFTTPGSEMISVTLTNQNGCDSSITFPVTILDGPAPFISGPTPACVSDISTYSVPAKQGHTYVWSVIGGSVVSFVIDSYIEVEWSVPGQGFVSCRQTSPDGCDSIASMFVLVNPLPTPIISGPIQLCQNENSTFFTGVNAGSTYEWSVNGNISSQTGAQFQENWVSTGNYIIQVNEINSSGCRLSDAVNVNVGSKPSAFINGSLTACINDGINNYFAEQQSGINYQWSIDTGGTILSVVNSDSLKVFWTSPGIHTITLIASNPVTGCDSTILFRVNADTLQKPVVTSLVSGCAPVNLSIFGNTNDPSYRYTWNFGDGSTSNLSNPSHQYTLPGLYSLNVISENGIGCKDTSFTTINVFPSPHAGFTIKEYKDFYMAGVENVELINLTTGANTYNWSFGNGMASNQFQPELIFVNPGIFIIKLFVSNSSGCIDSVDLPVEIRVPENVFVPNTFTPNGDEVNDFFSMSFLNVRNVTVSIFNRWGEEIFSSKDTEFHWDGTYKGRPVQPEVYVYLIDAIGYYGTEIRKVGKITLLR